MQSQEKTEVSEQKSEDDSRAEETAPKAEQAKAEDPEKDEFVIKFTNLEKYIGNSEHVVVPVGVKRISDNAFEGCETIKKVELPGGVEEIGGYAFHNCKNLEEIVIRCEPFEDRQLGVPRLRKTQISFYPQRCHHN